MPTYSRKLSSRLSKKTRSCLVTSRVRTAPEPQMPYLPSAADQYLPLGVKDEGDGDEQPRGLAVSG
jgi:hypothetical protein